MKKHYILLYLLFFLPFMGLAKEKALAPTVTLSTEAVAASNIAISNTDHLVYKLKVVSTEAFVLNGFSFKLDGTFNAGNLQFAFLESSTFLTQNGGTPIASLAIPAVSNGNTINFTGLTQSISANTPMYFYLKIRVALNCPENIQIKIDGGANPITLASTASTLTIINNQTDICGPFTTIKNVLTCSTEPIAPLDVQIGTYLQMVYVLKVQNTLPVGYLEQVSVKLDGTFLAGDLSAVEISLSSTPTPSGIDPFRNYTKNIDASTLSNGNSITANGLFWYINSGNATNYILIRVTINNLAVAGRTVKVVGTNNPITLSSNSSPFNVVNNQTDIAGPLTIIGPQFTISTEPLPASFIAPGGSGIIYAAKLTSTTGGNLNGINIPIQGTFTNTDINIWEVYIANTPTANSGTYFGAYSFANGILSNIPNNNAVYYMPINSTKYIIVKPKLNLAAIIGHTFKVNGASNSPILVSNNYANITNNQSDLANIQTIRGPVLTVTTEPLVSNTHFPGSSPVIYTFKILSDKQTAINTISFKVNGNFTAGQMEQIFLYESSNAFLPSNSSTSLITNTKISGDIITLNFNNQINGFLQANSPRYYFIVAKTSSILPDGYTFKVDGLNNMINITSGASYPTPTIINNQTDITELQTILGVMPSTPENSIINNIGSQEKTAYTTTLGRIIAKISAPSPITGTTNCFVWPTGAIARGYVPRHYEINPPAASSGASATVTLYFTQADFDAFNVISSTDIPTGPADTQGIANLRLDKYSGPSTAGSNGLDYASDFPSQFINPDDNKIIWNALASRWEITFDVTGFSGFFVGGTATPLPINLISFSGKNVENNIHLHWKTSLETNFSHFEIQRSINAKTFEKIGQVAGNASEYYEFLDANAPSGGWGAGVGLLYYRLRMVDLDGSSSFSKTIAVNYEKNSNYLTFENPVKNGELILKTNYKNPTFTILNSLGQNMEASVYPFAENTFLLKTKNIVKGMYFLNIQAADKIITRKLLME